MFLLQPSFLILTRLMFRFAETAVWRTAVNALQDIVDIVTQSAVCNEVEVVGWKDGIPLIPIYDWSSYT